MASIISASSVEVQSTSTLNPQPGYPHKVRGFDLHPGSSLISMQMPANSGPTRVISHSPNRPKFGQPHSVVGVPVPDPVPAKINASGTLAALAKCDSKQPSITVITRESSDGFDRDLFMPINLGFALAEEHDKQHAIPRKKMLPCVDPTNDSQSSSSPTTTSSSSSTSSGSGSFVPAPNTQVMRHALHVASLNQRARGVMAPPSRPQGNTRGSAVKPIGRHSIGVFRSPPRPGAMTRMQTQDDSQLEIARRRQVNSVMVSSTSHPMSAEFVGMGLKASGKPPKKASRFSLARLMPAKQPKWDPEEAELKQWILYQRLFRSTHITDKQNRTFPVDSQWVQRGFCLIGDLLDAEGRVDWRGICQAFDPAIHKVVRTQVTLVVKAIPREWLAVLRGVSTWKDRSRVKQVSLMS